MKNVAKSHKITYFIPPCPFQSFGIGRQMDKEIYFSSVWNYMQISQLLPVHGTVVKCITTLNQYVSHWLIYRLINYLWTNVKRNYCHHLDMLITCANKQEILFFVEYRMVTFLFFLRHTSASPFVTNPHTLLYTIQFILHTDAKWRRIKIRNTISIWHRPLYNDSAHPHTHTSDAYSGDEVQCVYGREVEGTLIEFAQRSSGEWKWNMWKAILQNTGTPGHQPTPPTNTIIWATLYVCVQRKCVSMYVNVWMWERRERKAYKVTPEGVWEFCDGWHWYRKGLTGQENTESVEILFDLPMLYTWEKIWVCLTMWVCECILYLYIFILE